MIPIIFYIDKTQVSTSGKLSIHPVQMSLGILTEKVST
jgi:Plavaka transposase